MDFIKQAINARKIRFRVLKSEFSCLKIFRTLTNGFCFVIIRPWSEWRWICRANWLIKFTLWPNQVTRGCQIRRIAWIYLLESCVFSEEEKQIQVKCNSSSDVQIAQINKCRSDVFLCLKRIETETEIRQRPNTRTLRNLDTICRYRSNFGWKTFLKFTEHNNKENYHMLSVTYINVM